MISVNDQGKLHIMMCFMWLTLFKPVFPLSQHAILAKKFVEVMTKYNEAQVDFRDKSKGRIARQLEISKLQMIHVTKSLKQEP